jgi:hypothetical protein
MDKKVIANLFEITKTVWKHRLGFGKNRFTNEQHLCMSPTKKALQHGKAFWVFGIICLVVILAKPIRHRQFRSTRW